MPTISSFYGILIRMYFNEHSPPHFHVKYAEFEATIDIQSLTLSDGKLPRRALNLTLDWAELHQNELLEAWELCQNKQPPNKISPLE